MSNIKKSKSEQFLEKRGAVPHIDSGLLSPNNISKTSSHMSQGIPQVSALMAKSISEYRRDTMTDEVKQGLFRDGSGPNINEDGITSNSIVSASIGVTKQAQVVSGGNGSSGADVNDPNADGSSGGANDQDAADDNDDDDDDAGDEEGVIMTATTARAVSGA